MPGPPTFMTTSPESPAATTTFPSNRFLPSPPAVITHRRRELLGSAAFAGSAPDGLFGFEICTRSGAFYSAVEQRQLDRLITCRSVVRIHPAQLFDSGMDAHVGHGGPSFL